MYTKGGKDMANKKYPVELKEQAVKEYLQGVRHRDILLKYDIHRQRLSDWVKQWREHGAFPDGRGKSKHTRTGRPRLHTTKKEEMTKDEYIAYLEMQLEIKKYLAFYEKRKQK
jgi:transposase-like protein